ncbi:MAG: hypothetical protein QOG69_2630 [Actinomycetota bacterium]|nr:hypothetical protein [Actinomycetota bacterium]
MPAHTHPGRRSAAVVLAALAALVLAWLVVPPVSTPLYDGIGAPDEPYRYVAPPAGAKHTQPPHVATADSDAAGGTNLHPFYVSSDEIGPQILMFISKGSLVVPSGVTGVRVTATPLAPDQSPAGATIDGNVYRVTATALAGTSVQGPLTFGSAGASESTITMRATSARQPSPSFVFRATPSDTWQRVTAVRVGNDIYRATVTHAGDYALAFFTSGAHGKSNTVTQALEIGGLALVILAAIIVVIRLSRRRGVG